MSSINGLKEIIARWRVIRRVVWFATNKLIYVAAASDAGAVRRGDYTAVVSLFYGVIFYGQTLRPSPTTMNEHADDQLGAPIRTNCDGLSTGRRFALR